jgi:prophage regulatory protein
MANMPDLLSTAREFDASPGNISVRLPDELMPIPRTETVSGMKRSQIYEMIKKGAFPRPVKLGVASRWSLHEVQKWVADQLRKRDAAHDTTE